MNIKQMERVSLIWGILLVALVIILTIFGLVYKSKSSDYKVLENDLVEVAKQYVDAKFLYPEDKKSVKVYFEEMKRDGYISDLSLNDDSCDGYVLVTHNGTVFEYKGFVQCAKYTTLNYEK